MAAGYEMATKRKSKRASAKGQSTVTVLQDKDLSVRLVIEVPDGSEPYYSNHLEVGHSKFDFFFAVLAPPSEAERDDRQGRH
jgi:hypothetical protein